MARATMLAPLELEIAVSQAVLSSRLERYSSAYWRGLYSLTLLSWHRGAVQRQETSLMDCIRQIEDYW